MFQLVTHRSARKAIFAFLAVFATASASSCQARPAAVPATSQAKPMAIAAAASSTSGLCPLGVNVTLPEFVDVMRSANPFTAMEGQKDFAADAQGWPKSDAQVVVYDVRVNQPWDHSYPDAVDEDRSGAYHLSFLGQATVAPPDPGMFTISRQVYKAATNTTTAILTKPKGPGLLVIKFTGTRGGVRNVKLIRPGYPANTKQTFSTPFLDAIKPFAAMRFLDYLQTNNYSHPANAQQYPAMTEWKNRRLPTDASQAEGPGKYGGSWEVAAQLANETGKDMWINIPIAATDEYITGVANVLKKTANPNLHIYVEYSNEAWNSGFPQNWWLTAAAKAENLDGRIRYAKREMEISNSFRKVFGDDAMNTRIRPVLMWQEPEYYAVWEMLKWIDKTYGPAGKFLYGVGGAAYFSSDNMTSVDAILAGLIRSSADTRKHSEGWSYLARMYGMKNLSYEGGVALGSEKDLLVPLEANRDPRIGPILKHHLIDNWYAAGGDLFMYYNLQRTPSQWGFWGLIDNDYTKPNTPKYRAAVEVAKTPRPAIHFGTVFPSRVGQSVSLDENNYFTGNFTPGNVQAHWENPGDRRDYPIDVPVVGTYSIAIDTIRDLPGTEQVWIDGKMIGNEKLPETVTATLSAGLHSLWLVAQGTSTPERSFVTGLGGGKQIVITRTK